MTIEEYTKYSNHAINIFNYMNGNINRLCSCILEIGSYDFITGNRAIITYPNRITLYIGMIIGVAILLLQKSSMYLLQFLGLWHMNFIMLIN